MNRHISSLFVITAFAIGCGGESASNDDTAQATQTASSNAPTNACALLPASEVTAVIGEPVRDSLALNMTGSDGRVTLSQCNYATATSAAAASLMLRQSTAGESLTQALAGLRETFKMSGVTPQDVPGLGDGALWGADQLQVVSNKGWTIIVTPARTGGLEQARAIAERAISRL